MNCFSTDPAHDTTHLTRVWATAQTLLQDHPEADAEVVHAACLWHDCVNLPKNHPQRAQASRMAAEKAVAALRARGFPAHKLDAVAHAIEAHSFSAGIAPQTIEAKIVQDADRLDALGPVGIARMFSVGGQLGRALDHIEVKLATLPASMQTAAGRRLGEERMAWIRSFQAAFVLQWLPAATP